jgi:hypothetical protein
MVRNGTTARAHPVTSGYQASGSKDIFPLLTIFMQVRATVPISEVRKLRVGP